MIKYTAVVTALILASCASNRTAQTGTSTPGKTASTDVRVKEAEAEDVMLVELEVAADAPVVEEVASVRVNSEIEFLKSIQYNPKYGIAESLNDRYDLYWEKSASNRYSNLGIVDKNGNVILPHLFSKRGSVTNNEVLLAMAETNYGLFNLTEMRWTIPLVYQHLTSLGGNLYSARKDYKAGVIDHNNAVVVPFQWKSIENIYNLENYILVSTDDVFGIYSIIEKKLALPCQYNAIRKLERGHHFLVRQGSKHNIVDINNKPVFSKWYDEIRTSSNNPDYFIVRDNNRYGVVDHTEKIIVPLTYMEMAESNFADGSYLARNKDGKYGCMTITGKVTLPFIYDNMKRNYSNNILSVQDGKCGLVRVNNGLPVEIVTCEFDNIREGTKAFIVEKAGKFGLLNQNGEQITPLTYESLEMVRDNTYDNATLYVGRTAKSVRLIDEQGKVIGSGDFTEIAPLNRKSTSSSYSQRFVYFKVRNQAGKCGLMDKVGRVVVQPQFDDIVSEDDNIAVIKSKDKCGLYSLLLQKLLLEYEYDVIFKHNEHYIGVIGKDFDFLQVRSDGVTRNGSSR